MGLFIAVPNSGIVSYFCCDNTEISYACSGLPYRSLTVYSVEEGDDISCNVYYIADGPSISQTDITDWWAYRSNYNAGYIDPKYLPPTSYIYSNYGEGRFNCPSNFGGPDAGINGVHCVVLDYGDLYTGLSWNAWGSDSTANNQTIYVTNNSAAPKTSYPYLANHRYSFTFEVFGENNYDGIMISTNGSLGYGDIRMNDAAGEGLLPSSTSGYIAHCSGRITILGGNTKATKTSVWQAPASNGTMYLYFRTDSGTIWGPGVNQSSYEYGNVIIQDLGETQTEIGLYFNKNGGSGGTGTLYGYSGQSINTITNGSISIPSRTGFDFLGYFTALSGGDQCIDEFGISHSSATLTQSTTLYAHWGNRITWNPYSQVEVWATDDDNTSATTLQYNTSETIATTSPSAKMGSVSVSVSPSGFSLSNSNRTLGIPIGTTSGTNATITVTSTGSGTNYEAMSKIYRVRVIVKQNYVAAYYDGLIIEQYEDLPASGGTLGDSLTIEDYFQVSQYGTTTEYANGYRDEADINYLPSGGYCNFYCYDPAHDNFYLSIPNCGTYATDRGPVSFPEDAYIGCDYQFPEGYGTETWNCQECGNDFYSEGEPDECPYCGATSATTGFDYVGEDILMMNSEVIVDGTGDHMKVYQEENLPSLTVTTTSNSIQKGGNTNITVMANFPSGSSLNVTDVCRYEIDPSDKVTVGN